MNLERRKLDVLSSDQRLSAIRIYQSQWLLTFCSFSELRGSFNALMVSSIKPPQTHDTKDAATAKGVSRTMAND